MNDESTLGNSGIIQNSVDYRVEMDFSIDNEDSVFPLYLKCARLNNKTPYQESQLKNFIMPSEKNLKSLSTYNDNYSNTFDYMKMVLYQYDKISMKYQYKIRLSKVKFNIHEKDILPYDYSTKIFELYCRKPDQLYNINDPELIKASHSIVGSTDNPIEKAKKIFNWVSQSITYEIHKGDKGASWTYRNRKGDCSEFSSLLVTLLRIQGIPARRVIGFLVSNDPTLKPKVGDVWSYTNKDIMRHAWVEYYINNIGWIQCDPTWHGEYFDYFNTIDYLRFTEVIGSRFFFPDNLTLYSFFTTPFYSSSFDLKIDYKIKITVISVIKGSNEFDFEDLIPITTMSVVGIMFFYFIVVHYIIKKRNLKKRVELKKMKLN